MSRLTTLLKQARQANAQARDRVEELTITAGQPIATGSPLNAGILDQYGNRVSTRVPSAKDTAGQAMRDELIIGTEAVMEAKAYPQMARALAKQLGISRINLRNADARIMEVINQQVENLLWLHDQVDPEIRARSKQWYSGANRFVHEWSDGSNRFSARGIAGAVAALSPQRDWFQNASLASRTIDVIENRGNVPIDEEMVRVFADSIARGKDGQGRPLTNIGGYTAEDAAKLIGKTFDELEGKDKALFVRMYDQAYNPSQYRVVSPEGESLGIARKAPTKAQAAAGEPGDPASVSWGSLSEIDKAISMLENDSLENISEQLGDAHKVRNFYNNIIDPDDPNAVTIDTHAVAAGLLRPLSGSSAEVTLNLSGPGGAAQGTSGTYGILADVYRIAAAERGILPREMQSITWEAIRGMYSPQYKQGLSRQRKPLRKGGRPRLDEIDQVAMRFKRGEIGVDDFRSQILELSGGITDPAWYRAILGPGVMTAAVAGGSMTPDQAEAAPFGTLRRIAGVAAPAAAVAGMAPDEAEAGVGAGIRAGLKSIGLERSEEGWRYYGNPIDEDEAGAVVSEMVRYGPDGDDIATPLQRFDMAQEAAMNGLVLTEPAMRRAQDSFRVAKERADGMGIPLRFENRQQGMQELDYQNELRLRQASNEVDQLEAALRRNPDDELAQRRLPEARERLKALFPTVGAGGFVAMAGVSPEADATPGQTMPEVQDLARQIEGMRPTMPEMVALDAVRAEAEDLMASRDQILAMDPMARDDAALQDIEMRLQELAGGGLLKSLRDRQQTGAELGARYRELTGADYGTTPTAEQRMANITRDSAARFNARRASPRSRAISGYTDLIRAQFSSPWASADAAVSMASAMAGEVFGGLTMLGAAPGEGVDAAVERGQGVQEAMTMAPRTDAGSAVLRSVGELFEAGMDAALQTEIGRDLSHFPGYWREEVVPALQEELGDEAGSVAGALGVGIPNALL